jgi:ribosomal protein L24E
MANPDVLQNGIRWEMYFNVLEPTVTDLIRLDVWKTSSASPTDWSQSSSTPVIVMNGTSQCSALAPDVLPAAGGLFDIYYGLVVPDALGVCADLTQSTSIVLRGESTSPERAASLPTSTPQGCSTMSSGTVVGMAVTRDDGGYWIVDARGQVVACGDASPGYSQTSAVTDSPVVGIAVAPSGNGYWLVASDGGIFSFNAPFEGSMGGTPLNKRIVGMAATPDGKGYWLVASDGGIFAFGAASFFGSTGARKLNQPIVGMAATPDGKGYWLVASDGGIFSFGAPFEGSMGGTRLNQPIVGMAATPDGKGYWLVAADGGIFAFGAPFEGSMGGTPLNQPIVGLAATPDGKGYWLVAADGGIFAFGDASFFGSTGAQKLN